MSWQNSGENNWQKQPAGYYSQVQGRNAGNAAQYPSQSTGYTPSSSSQDTLSLPSSSQYQSVPKAQAYGNNYPYTPSTQPASNVYSASGNSQPYQSSTAQYAGPQGGTQNANLSQPSLSSQQLQQLLMSGQLLQQPQQAYSPQPQQTSVYPSQYSVSEASSQQYPSSQPGMRYAQSQPSSQQIGRYAGSRGGNVYSSSSHSLSNPVDRPHSSSRRQDSVPSRPERARSRVFSPPRDYRRREARTSPKRSSSSSSRNNVSSSSRRSRESERHRRKSRSPSKIVSRSSHRSNTSALVRSSEKRKYEVKISKELYSQKTRCYLTIMRRHPRLYVCHDFQRAIAMWPETIPFSKKLDISKPIQIKCETKKLDRPKDSQKHERSYSSGIHYSAKVILLSGAPGGLSTSHLSQQIKFLIAKRDRNELLLFGGPWSKSIDGGNPSQDRSALIKTVIRCVQEQTQMDISSCTHWYPFMEIHYVRRSQREEITVVFIANTSSLLNPKRKGSAEDSTTKADAMELDGCDAEQDTIEENQKPDEEEKGRVGEEKTQDKDNEDEEKEEEDEGEDKEKEDKDEDKEKEDNDKDNEKEDNEDEDEDEDNDNEKEDNDEDNEKEDEGNENEENDKKQDSAKAEGEIETAEEANDKSEVNKDQMEEDKSNTKKEAISNATKPIRFEKKRTGLQVVTDAADSHKFRGAMISLDGLLDYDESDRFEDTFEVSLFAEMFQDMLHRDFASTIFAALEALPLQKEESQKRKRETGDASSTPAAKKIKTSHEQKEASKPNEGKDEKESEAKADTTDKEAEKKTPEREIKTEAEASTESKEAESSKKRETETETDTALLQAFQYFDRNRTGYLKVKDVETVIHNLGNQYSKRFVRDLVCRAADKKKSSRLTYARLCLKKKAL
eukprot:TRINITY_DN1249_c0_g1_i2.p1 TRINITY_DN1249_c0_g1~~TRINITY_DN1249_c0_g1_i2.p1  ORF type:complete len:899 (-),score=190.05 TRINITY_DN1249_c0_g1_i2:1-2697(-)